MKKSITVLGVEADGIRGVRLEESGADWNCVDSEFWPIGGGRRVEDDATRKDVDGNGPEESSLAADEVDGALSSDDRYAATVDALTEAAKRFCTNEVVLSMPLSSLLVPPSKSATACLRLPARNLERFRLSRTRLP